MFLSSSALKYISELREEASHPNSVFQVIIIEGGGDYRIWPEDVLGKTDQEVMAFLIMKYHENKRNT